MTDEPVREAIQLVKSGKKDEAKSILEPFIRANPHHISAWLWEAETKDTIPGKIKILEMCLRFNPDEPQAIKALGIFKAQLGNENLVMFSDSPPTSPAPLPEIAAGQDTPSKRRPCPYCAEMVLEETVVCPFCGRDFQTGMIGASAEGKLLSPIIQAARPQRTFSLGGLAWAIILIVVGIIFYNTFGFFTVQPIGAIPEGVTMLVIRSGTQLQFFDSADAMCERSQGGVSLLCRLGALAALGNKKEIIILRLPYMESFYLLSTGGSTYDR